MKKFSSQKWRNFLHKSEENFLHKSEENFLQKSEENFFKKVRKMFFKKVKKKSQNTPICSVLTVYWILKVPFWVSVLLHFFEENLLHFWRKFASLFEEICFAFVKQSFLQFPDFCFTFFESAKYLFWFFEPRVLWSITTWSARPKLASQKWQYSLRVSWPANACQVVWRRSADGASLDAEQALLSRHLGIGALGLAEAAFGMPNSPLSLGPEKQLRLCGGAHCYCFLGLAGALGPRLRAAGFTPKKQPNLAIVGAP